MIIQNIKFAFRKLFKRKSHLIINITGLSLGMAVGSIILLNVCYEYSYDKFLDNAENTYRIKYDKYQNGRLVFQKAMSLYSIGPLMKEEIPEVKNYTRAGIERCLLYRNKVRFNDQSLFWADAAFLKVISVKMIRGNAYTALAQPYTMVVSKSSAEIFFGKEDPMGKIIFVNEHLPFTVTGIFEDLPDNSHLNFKVLLSLSTGNVLWPGWGTNNSDWSGDNWLYTYITLDKGADPAVVERKIAKVVEAHLPNELKKDNVLPKFTLQRLTDIHLKSNIESEIKPGGNLGNVYFMIMIGLIILVIAWINFFNISMAESAEKAKEVGVRKLIGAYRKNIVPQFLLEAFFVNVIGVVFAIGIIHAFLPLYSTLIDKPLVGFLHNHLIYYLFLFLMAILGAFLSGIYPAFVLSSFNPLVVLKGGLFNGKNKDTFRKVLVVAQLVATTVLIAGVLLIYKQIDFIRSKELGFDKSSVVVVPAPCSLNMNNTKQAKYKVFKSRLLANSSVEAVSSSYFVPGMEQVFDSRYMAFDNKKIDEVRFKNYMVDDGFLDVYKMKLVAGTNFFETQEANRDKIVINEAALSVLRLKDASEAVGHVLTSHDNRKSTIIGVYSDFHQESIHSGIKPVVYFYGHPDCFGNYSVRVKPEKITETIDFIEKEWIAQYPNDPFTYFFEDSYIDDLYKQDLRFGKLMILFTVLSVFVACIGLLGLIMIIAAKSSKAIGIHKVNGATVGEIIFLLAKDFLKCNTIAFLMATPVAYLLMNKWLENFAYRTEISWWIFALASLLALVITLLTVSWQSWQAATRNPVEALRHE